MQRRPAHAGSRRGADAPEPGAATAAARSATARSAAAASTARAAAAAGASGAQRALTGHRHFGRDGVEVEDLADERSQ